MSSSSNSKPLWQQTILHIYISGFILLAIFYVCWRIVKELSPWYGFVENPFLATVLSVMTVLLVPPILGCVMRFGINPLMGKWNRWSELVTLQDRLVGNLSEGEPAKIVLANWPSSTERTMGLMTAVFPATESQKELAAVHIPQAPRSKSGYIRFIPLAELEITNWTLKDFQLFQLSIGSLSPSNLVDED